MVQYVFKIILLGRSFSGKSSILQSLICYKNNTFEKYNKRYISTIGIDYGTYYYSKNNNKIKLSIWDTAGQDRFFSIVKSYYNSITAAILVYDITDRKSFYDIKKWYDSVISYSSNNEVIFMLIGNKKDLEHKRVVTYNEGLDMAQKHNWLFYEICAETDSYVIFELLGNHICDKIKDNKLIPADNNNIKLIEYEELKMLTINKKKCC